MKKFNPGDRVVRTLFSTGYGAIPRGTFGTVLGAEGYYYSVRWDAHAEKRISCWDPQYMKLVNQVQCPQCEGGIVTDQTDYLCCDCRSSLTSFSIS